MEYLNDGKKYYDVLLSWEDCEAIWNKHVSIKDFKNRAIDNNNVSKFCEIIEKGRFIPGMGPIEISPRGAIVDGQHRILAAIKTKSTIRVMITFEADEAMLPFFDTGGKRRTPSESMYMLDGPKSSIITCACRFILYYLRTGKPVGVGGDLVSKTFFDPVEVKTVYDKHTNLINEGVSFYSRQNMKRVSGALCVGFYVFFSTVDYEKARMFFTKLCEGVYLEKGDPVYALRNLLENNIHTASTLKNMLLVKSIIAAWNATLAGKKKFVFQTTQMKDIPAIAGFDKTAFLAGLSFNA